MYMELTAKVVSQPANAKIPGMTCFLSVQLFNEPASSRRLATPLCIWLASTALKLGQQVTVMNLSSTEGERWSQTWPNHESLAVDSESSWHPARISTCCHTYSFALGKLIWTFTVCRLWNYVCRNLLAHVSMEETIQINMLWRFDRLVPELEMSSRPHDHPRVET